MSILSVFAGIGPLPSPNDPLVSISDFAEWFGLTLDAAGTARAETALEIASADCRSETNQQLTQTSDTLTVTPASDGYLILPQWPVTEIASLVVDGNTMTEGTDYTWTDRGIVTPRTFCLRGYGWQVRTISVAYTHGWSPLPRDIAGVCLARAKRLYDAPDAQPVEKETIGTYSVTYAPLLDGLTEAEKYTLARYASWTNGY